MNKGFSPIPVSHHADLESRKCLVEVPPGGIIIFNERTVHEVLPSHMSKSDKAGKSGSQLAQCRLFLGWRTTQYNQPITPNLMERLRAQEGMPLKSGQHEHPRPPPGWEKGYPGPPPMYSNLTLTNQPLSLKRLASHLKPAATEFFQFQNEGPQSKRFKNGFYKPFRFLPSLRELNAKDPTISMYSAYTREEISMLYPDRVWRNLHAIDGSVRKVLTLNASKRKPDSDIIGSASPDDNSYKRMRKEGAPGN